MSRVNRVNPYVEYGDIAQQIQGGLKREYVGKRIYECWPYPTAYIAMTGAAVEARFSLEFGFRLVRFEWKHATAADADSTDATAITLVMVDPATNIQHEIYANAASANHDTVVPFGEGYEYKAHDLILSANTTATDRVYPRFWVQELRQ